MLHVGWFMWWTYKNDPVYRVHEFIDMRTKGSHYSEDFSIEREGEEYVRFLTEHLRNESNKYGMELD